jgi:hypothetical protein
VASPSLICDEVLHWAETTPPIGAHAMLCDPPYHLTEVTVQRHGSARWGEPRTDAEKAYRRQGTRGFMGKEWDGGDVAFRPETWQALAQHLLPGAFGMCFASARGWHRLACAIEDAGLILHPSVFMLGWAQGAGFPKATRIDTAVDKAAGAEREVLGPGRYASRKPRPYGKTGTSFYDDAYVWPAGDQQTAPATDLAATWASHRYGLQALKPALEPIIVWQKPYHGRPVDCITATGAGSLWIEGARVGIPIADVLGNPGPKRWPPNLALLHLPACQPVGSRTVQAQWGQATERTTSSPGFEGGWRKHDKPIGYAGPDGTEVVQAYACAPECPVAAFDRQAGPGRARGNTGPTKSGVGMWHHEAAMQEPCAGDAGPASRYMMTADWSLDVAEQLAHADPVFYTGKASQAERSEGLPGRNPHPTVKPIALCQWLATLLLPPAAYAPRRLLNPFAGSGSEAIGATLAGWEEIVGIEEDPATVALGTQRLTWWTTQIAAQLSLWPA